jgi:hypothetical protein
MHARWMTCGGSVSFEHARFPRRMASSAFTVDYDWTERLLAVLLKCLHKAKEVFP